LILNVIPRILVRRDRMPKGRRRDTTMDAEVGVKSQRSVLH
jgi:hypothetical protein